ncbi:MAG TPA: cytochrome c oxidase assembly protein [bacterium]|nr:cytochrome c oxidase assembly protein [bacterium]
MTTREFLLSAWDWNPLLIAICVGAFFIYDRLCRWSLSGRTASFITGMVLSFLALASPINFLANGILFSAHMFQHLLLVLIVPPLFLLGMPINQTHGRVSRRFIPWGNHPLIAWFSGVGVMWFWHIPALCDAAASNKPVHLLQIFSLLVLGVLFWRPIVGPRIEERLSPLAGILYLFSACIGCSLLGIWITFAPVSVCPVFMNSTAPSGVLAMIHDEWGMTPAMDQQIGGLLMWVPACLVYLGASLALLGRFYRQAPKNGGKE